MLRRIFLLSMLSISSAGVWLSAQEEQEEIALSDTISLSNVEVMAELPITSQKVSKNTISEKNLGQDMPILLRNSTSVVTTSDAGNGMGYTSMRIRGIAQSQINVTFNGVPVNDSESHGVFWVDFPDVASSTNGILIQRGVGTSSNGAAAFGGSVNLETDRKGTKPFMEAMAAYGSFNTQKYMVNAGSGDFLDGKLNVDGRVSYITTDGYIDRAESNLFSTALNLRYKPNANTEFHIMDLYGHEKTYQAWYGIDGATMEDNRTFNPAGAIYDENWEVVDYYDNQVDNYDQNHLHAYWKQKWNDTWKSTTTLHWTRGLGYYEEYTQGAALADYHVTNDDQVSDLVRRQWLDNHFYGGIFNLEARNLNDWDLYFGIAANKYVGGHYGKVEDVVDSNLSFDGKYYENESNKTELSTYAKALYKFDDFELFGDLQVRNINYDADYKNGGENPIKDFQPYDFNWTFVNPKAGINYRLPQSKVYFSYGLTHREPTRSDILADIDNVKPETLHDFELGYRTNKNVNFGINAYYMYYLDQLVLTGQVDDVGNPIRKNVGKSYRTGVELDLAGSLIPNKLDIITNFTWSNNKNLDYTIENDDGDLVNLGDTSIAYTPEIITSIGFDYMPIENLKLNLTHKYVSEQYVTNTEVNDGVLDAYFLTDFMAKYKLPFNNQTNVELTLLVNNLLDEKYANNGYYWSGTYYFPQAGRNFLLGVKVGF